MVGVLGTARYLSTDQANRLLYRIPPQLQPLFNEVLVRAQILRDESFNRLESVIPEMAGLDPPHPAESVISELAGFGGRNLLWPNGWRVHRPPFSSRVRTVRLVFDLFNTLLYSLFGNTLAATEREAVPRTPAERVDLSFTLRLPPDDMKFLEARRKELEANANAEALRDVIRNLRTCFGLPAFMVGRLEHDRKERGLSLMDYIKELLAMRYQELAKEPVSRASSSEKSPKR